MREISKSRNVLKPKLLATCPIAPDDQYQRVNMLWYMLFDEHYEFFLKLIKDNHISSAFVLGRTLLELFARSFYMEFIEKPKQTDVKLYLATYSLLSYFSHGRGYVIKQFSFH